MKDFRIVAKIYNNQLRERREELGLTQTALAAQIGIPAGTYCHLETMHDSPLTSSIGKFGRQQIPTWRESALRLAEFYKVTPEDLFPDSVLEIERTVAEVRVDAERVAAMLSVPAEVSPLHMLAAAEETKVLYQCLDVLTTRERDVIEKRFGLVGDNDGHGMSLREIADQYHLSHDRILQIEKTALRKLRMQASAIETAVPYPTRRGRST